MANLYLNLPVLSAGPGPAVDVSALGKTKTVVIGGSFQGNVLVEYATDLAGTNWAPVQAGGFTAPGRITLPLAAHWMRASSSGYSGAANVDVGASDAGASFAQLGAAPVDISSLPSFKTVVVSGPCKVEVSEDGIAYSQAFSFQAAGGQSALLIAQFARVTGGADAWIGGSDDAGGGGGAPFALLHFNWTTGVVLSQTNIASVSRPVADNGADFVGVRDFTFTTPIDDVNRAIITANVRAPIFWPFPEPPALRGPPVSAFPGLQCFAELESASVLRVWVYRCADSVNIPNGLMSEEALELWVHVARVSP